MASPPQRDHGGLPDPGVLAACALLGHHRGLRRRRGAGHRRLRVRRGVLRAGRHGHRAGQRLRDGGQAAAARPDRHRLRGRPDRGRDPRRRHRRPGARRGRPDQPGRARPAGRRGAGHRQRGARRRRPRRWCPAQVAATKHSDRITTALDGTQSGVVLVDDLDAGLRVVDAYAAEHLEIQTRDAARGGGAGAQRRGDLRRRRGRRCRWATTAPAPTTCCPPAAARGTPAACRCSRSCAASTSSSTTSGRWPRWPGTSTRWPARRTCPRTRPPSASGSRLMTDARPSSRCGRSCGAARPTAPRSCRRRYRLNTNENPYPLPAELLADLGTALGHAALRAQPLSRPGRRRAAHRPGRLPEPRRAASRSSRRRCGRPTAPTRCCSRSCRRSAAAGGRRWASRRRTRCTRSSPPAPAPPGSTGTAGADFTIDAGRRRGAGARAAPGRRLRDQPEQPDRHRRGAGDDRASSTTRPQGVLVVDEAYEEFARAGTPVGAHPAARAAAADRQPDDEQGVRHGRAAAGLPGRRPGGGRRAAAGAAAVPPQLAHPGRRAHRAGAHRRAAGHGRRGQGAARPDRRRAARRWG